MYSDIVPPRSCYKATDLSFLSRVSVWPVYLWQTGSSESYLLFSLKEEMFNFDLFNVLKRHYSHT